MNANKTGTGNSITASIVEEPEKVGEQLASLVVKFDNYYESCFITREADNQGQFKHQKKYRRHFFMKSGS